MARPNTSPQAPLSRTLATSRVALVLGLAGVGCYGVIDGTAPSGSVASTPNGGPAPGGVDPVGTTTSNGDANCTGAPGAAKPPLRRLTRREYNNTIRDLLGAAPLSIMALGIDESAHVFGSNTLTPVSELQFSRYAEAAEALATAGVATASAAAGCVANADSASNAACAQKLATTFGRKVYRRPLTSDEVAGYVALFQSESSQAGTLAGVKLVIETMLQSPHFLYRVELGSAPSGAIVALSPYELASRLSYFLWASAPDDALLDAATAGALATPEGLEKQARRLLADAKAADAVTSFYGQWLGIDTLAEVQKDAATFPGWDANLALAMQKETDEFTKGILLHGDARLETLLLGPSTYTTTELGNWYGTAPRAGLLTQGSVLSINAHQTQTSPVLRGKFVRERLLCQTPPPPPPNLDTTPPQVDPNVSTRERFSQHRANPVCAGCHQHLDPIGFGFESFDAVGRPRSMDGNQPVDDSGELLGTDVDGTFRGPLELAKKLAGSALVQDCVTQHWLEFALGSAASADTACSLRAAGEAFRGSKLDTRELMIAITRSDAFRNIRVQ